MRAVHTPGHTPGHLCFAEERTGCSSPATTCCRASARTSPARTPAPPIRCATTSTRWPRSAARSRWRCCRPTSGASAGWAARTAELTAHHEHRLAELLDAIRRNPGSTPWQLAAHLTWSRPWDQYERRMRIFAVTETDAHLRLLASRGLVVSDGGAVPTWTVGPALTGFAALAERVRAAPPRLGGTRLVCVDGPAGSGKTTFAARLAAAARPGHRRRCTWTTSTRAGRSTAPPPG